MPIYLLQRSVLHEFGYMPPQPLGNAFTVTRACLVAWLCLTALFLSGCDDQHGAKAAVLSSVPAPVSTTAVTFVAGDSLSYGWTSTTSAALGASAASYSSTDITTQVNTDGSTSRVLTRSGASPLEQRNFTATGQETAFQSGAATC